MIKQQFEVTPGYKKWSMGLLGVGGLVLVLGFVFLGLSSDEHNQTRFWAVLLQNSIFFLLICNASMFFICITTLAMGGWQVAFRRVPEAISALVPVFAILALVVFHRNHLWSSARIFITGSTKNMWRPIKILKGKSAFLNPTFFFVWTIITLAVWTWWEGK